MKCLEIRPSRLSGTVNIPPSKSMTHRAIMCAFLACGISEIDNIELSEDIMSTCQAVTTLGGRIDISESTIPNRKTYNIRKRNSFSRKRQDKLW